MALTLKESDEMISAAKKQHVILQIGFMRRFSPEFQAAKRQLREGAIGKLTLIKSTGRGPGLPPPWACDPRTSIGMLAEVNSHDFDTARWLMESEVEKLYAEAEALAVPEYKERYEDFYDRSVVVLRFRNKALGMIDGACPVKYGYDARVEILGTEGVMLVGELKNQAVVTCTKERGAYSSFFPSWRDRFGEGYLEEDRHFVDCIVNDREPLASGEDGRAVLELTLAATKSFKTGEPITLPLE
jgi:myo-inositol 2-dehydrogenase/D-chiro-inositol 1-dehydrogenase/scyllo-inositol 2-dehydrogenase (NAD+)